MTDKATDYDGYDEGVIEASLDRAVDDYFGDDGATGEPTSVESDDDDQDDDSDDGGSGVASGGGGDGGGGRAAPTRIQVTGRIEWAGEEDRARGGRRTTTLDGLRLDGVVDKVRDARRARDAVESAPVPTSMRAKGWQAQLKFLTGHGSGSAAADKVGLNPNEKTLMGWLGGNEPSKANQRRIAEAYDAVRTRHIDAARASSADSRHQVADELSAALSRRYGVDIRIRDISNLKFLD